MKSGLLCLILLLPGACLALEAFEADYRLLYNDEAKGEAHFSLKIVDQGKGYSFKAVTRPLDASRQDHEVIEASHGHFDGTRPEPDSYYYAVHSQGSTQMTELFFDWQRKLLTLRSDDGQQKFRLEEGTQDRLSYLLRAMALSAGLRTEASFPRVAIDGADRLILHKRVRKHIDTPAGRYLAQEVAIYSGKKTAQPVRRLWLAVHKGWLPLAMEYHNGNGVVRMELTHMERE
jgi:hypothetical protein